MSEVLIGEGGFFEAALKKFARKVQQDGLLSEAKRRQHYEPPSVKRKRKADAHVRHGPRQLPRDTSSHYICRQLLPRHASAAQWMAGG